MARNRPKRKVLAVRYGLITVGGSTDRVSQDVMALACGHEVTFGNNRLCHNIPKFWYCGQCRRA